MASDKELDQNQADLSPSLPEKKEDILAVEEVVVEELAIDGICGVY